MADRNVIGKLIDKWGQIDTDRGTQLYVAFAKDQILTTGYSISLEQIISQFKADRLGGTHRKTSSFNDDRSLQILEEKYSSIKAYKVRRNRKEKLSLNYRIRSLIRNVPHDFGPFSVDSVCDWLNIHSTNERRTAQSRFLKIAKKESSLISKGYDLFEIIIRTVDERISPSEIRVLEILSNNNTWYRRKDIQVILEIRGVKISESAINQCVTSLERKELVVRGKMAGIRPPFYHRVDDLHRPDILYELSIEEPKTCDEEIKRFQISENNEVVVSGRQINKIFYASTIHYVSENSATRQESLNGKNTAKAGSIFRPPTEKEFAFFHGNENRFFRILGYLLFIPKIAVLEPK